MAMWTALCPSCCSPVIAEMALMSSPSSGCFCKKVAMDLYFAGSNECQYGIAGGGGPPNCAGSAGLRDVAAELPALRERLSAADAARVGLGVFNSRRG